MKSACRLCGSGNIASLSKSMDYSQCGDCQFVWSKKSQNVHYNADYYQGRSSLLSAVFCLIFNFFYWLRRQYVGDKKYKLWIDVGAGDGAFLKTVKADKRIGVEISSSGRQMMQDLGLDVLSDKEFLKKSCFKADVISFWHVLEHTSDPESYIQAAKQNLAPTGKLVIGVPNISSWEFKLFGKKWFHYAHPYHQRHFSPSSLGFLLQKNGFRVKKKDYFSPEHHFSGLLQSFINWRSDSKDVLHKLTKRSSEQFTGMSFANWLWVLFWISLGLPLVAAFWVFASLTGRPGAFVVVATLKKR